MYVGIPTDTHVKIHTDLKDEMEMSLPENDSKVITLWLSKTVLHLWNSFAFYLYHNSSLENPFDLGATSRARDCLILGSLELDYLARVMEKELCHKWGYGFSTASKYSCFGYRIKSRGLLKQSFWSNNLTSSGSGASDSISKRFCFEVFVPQYVFPAKHMPVIWNQLKNFLSHFSVHV